MSRLALRVCVLAASVLLLSQCVSAQSDDASCQAFQAFSTPRAMAGGYCTSMRANSCCDNGNAKRASNWAFQDDGCGVVKGQCLQLLIDAACHSACAPAMNVTTTSHGDIRPVVSEEWAERAWAACGAYSWCGTNAFAASTCTFLVTSKTRLKGGKTIRGQVTVGAQDTCTYVAELEPKEFVETMLFMQVGGSNATALITDPVHQVAKLSGAPSLTSPIALIALLIGAVLTMRL